LSECCLAHGIGAGSSGGRCNYGVLIGVDMKASCWKWKGKAIMNGMMFVDCTPSDVFTTVSSGPFPILSICAYYKDGSQYLYFERQICSEILDLAASSCGVQSDCPGDPHQLGFMNTWYRQTG
jgi:hypothetical protein